MRMRGIDEITSKSRTRKVAGRGTCRCPEGSVISRTKKGTLICARRRSDAPVFAKKNAAGTGCVAGAQKKKFKNKNGFYCLKRRPGWLWAGAPVCDVAAPKGKKKKSPQWISPGPFYAEQAIRDREYADWLEKSGGYVTPGPSRRPMPPRGPGGRFIRRSRVEWG